VCDKVHRSLDGATSCAYARRVAREPRIDTPGWHHVNTSAVDGLVAFADRHDVRVFNDTLTYVVRRFDWTCACYCVMGTHYHVLVFLVNSTLARGIHILNSVLAHRFNERRDRKGHMFGARYFSAYVESQSHLLEVFRYIELNPVRAGLCSDPADWEWSSFRPIMGLARAPEFLSVSAAHELFGRTPETARAEYARFVRLGLLAA
jgi:putative transposase